MLSRPAGLLSFITSSRRIQSLDFQRNGRHAPHVTSEHQTPDRHPESHSTQRKEDFQRTMGPTNKDCRFRIFTLTNSLFQQHLLVGRTEVCTCSQFPTEAMHWIKEVEMVESVDDLKSSRSIRGTPGLNFELLEKKVSLEEMKAHKEDRFLRGRQIACLIYEYFQVTGANDSVENYADLFTVVFRNGDIQEFDSKWSEILLSMTQIPSDDILESLYKLRIRESEKLKTVLELYNMEIHQKKAGPDYHRLKTMVKRMKNFEARNGNFETSAVVKNQRGKQREQRSLGDCWQWKTNGQCSKGDNGSFRHFLNKRIKSTQPNPSPRFSTQQRVKNALRTRSPGGRSPSGKMARLPCKDYFKGTCTTPICQKWHPPECLFYKSDNVCRFGEKCSHAHRQVDEQPSKKSKKNGDKIAVAVLRIHDNWVAYFKIWSRRSLRRFCGRAETY